MRGLYTKEHVCVCIYPYKTKRNAPVSLASCPMSEKLMRGSSGSSDSFRMGSSRPVVFGVYVCVYVDVEGVVCNMVGSAIHITYIYVHTYRYYYTAPCSQEPTERVTMRPPLALITSSSSTGLTNFCGFDEMMVRWWCVCVFWGGIHPNECISTTITPQQSLFDT
jgi:hypothetical protein